MREIKFRGKKEDNSEWVFGFIEIHLVDGDLTQNKQTAFITCDTMNKIGKVYRDTFKVIPETAGQYTGLKDKNGKGIFEGDLVEHEMEVNGVWELYEASEAVFDDDNGIYCFKDDSPNLLTDYKNLEVVGNIHDKAKTKGCE